ncbi:MAG TPA: DUF2914 domain-containing protein, partial [Fibrobacteraceae bacterium]|nr:DUF2914 domain-containing protein [Fibrobacteraceae bacterium]
LWILSGYWAAAFLALLFLGRNPGAAWQRRFTWVVQFCFGSLFSALVVFYFRSSGSLFTLISVAILVILLLLNEALKDRYERLGLSWSIFCLSGTMFLNFLVPHLVHSVGTIWFVLSTLLGFLPIYVLWKLSHRSATALLAPLAVSVGIFGFWALDLLPPVPLVMKQNIVCRNFEHQGGDYTCLAPQQGFLVRMGLADFKIYQGDEPTFVLSSVFAPTQVTADLEHRWEKLDEVKNEWKDYGRVPFHMQGGRAAGWRLYSNKQTLEPGYWRVQTAVRDGAVVGYTEFRVLPGSDPEGTPYERVMLK